MINQGIFFSTYRNMKVKIEHVSSPVKPPSDVVDILIKLNNVKGAVLSSPSPWNRGGISNGISRKTSLAPQGIQ